MKKLSGKTEKNPREPQPNCSNNVLGSWAYSSCHEKRLMDIYGWGFKLYVRFCVCILSGKNILFFTFNRSVSNAQFFFVKYMFAMLPTKE